MSLGDHDAPRRLFRKASGAGRALALALALICPVSPLPATALASGTGSTPAAQEAPRQGVAPGPEGTAVALITTTDVSNSVVRALNELGIPHAQFSGPPFTGIDLAPYSEIFVTMDGGTMSEADIAHLGTWTSAGGILHFIGGSNYTPFAVGVETYLVDIDAVSHYWTTVSGVPDVSLTDPGHYLATALPATYDFLDASASYYMARNQDPAIGIAAHNGDGYPVLFDKEVGAGHFDWFLNSPFTYYWSNEPDYQVLKQVVANMLDGPGLRASPGSVRQGLEPGALAGRTVTLTNGFDFDVVLHAVGASQPWLQLDYPAFAGLSDTLRPDSTRGIGLTLDATSLAVGVYSDTIKVNYHYLPPPEGRAAGPPEVFDSLRVVVTLGVTHAPAITGPATVYATECQGLEFTATAGDEDGDELTWFPVDLPDGASIEPYTGFFQWDLVEIPVTDALIPLTYGVSDGFLADTTTTQLDVREIRSTGTFITFETFPDETPVPDDPEGGGEVTGLEWLSQGVRFTPVPLYEGSEAFFNVVGEAEYHEPVSPPNALAVVDNIASSYGYGAIEITFPASGAADGGEGGTVDFIGGWLTGQDGGEAARAGAEDPARSGIYVQLLDAFDKELDAFSLYSLPVSFCGVHPGQIAKVRIEIYGYYTALDDFFFGHIALNPSVAALRQGVEPGESESREITLRNNLDSPVVVQEVSATQPWIGLDLPGVAAAPDTLETGESFTFGVTLDAGALPVDVYQDAITVAYLTSELPAARAAGGAAGGFVPDTLVIPVTMGVTHRPQIDGPSTVEAIECGSVYFAVSATDPDGDPVEYRLGAFPTGLHPDFDPESGDFYLDDIAVPTARYAPLQFTLLATDGFLADTLRTVIQALEVRSAATVINFDVTAAGDSLENNGKGGGEITGEEWLPQGVLFQPFLYKSDGPAPVAVLNLVDEGWIEDISPPYSVNVCEDSFSTYAYGALEITFPAPVDGDPRSMDYVGGYFPRDLDLARRTGEQGALGEDIYIEAFDSEGKWLDDEYVDEYDGGEFCFVFPGRIASVRIYFYGVYTGLDDFWFGTFDTGISLAVLQNPVLTSQVDVIAAPKIALEGAPVIMAGGDVLEAEEIGESPTRLWRARRTLGAGGVVSITATGVSTIEGRAAAGALEFTSFPVAREGGAMASPDGGMEVMVPAGAVSEPLHLLLLGPGSAAHSPYEIGPAGRALPGMEVRFRAAGTGARAAWDPARSAVWLERGGVWEELPSTLDPATGMLVAEPPVTGPLAVRARSGAGQTPALARTISLAQNAPNPFRPETWIAFELARPAPVTLRVFDVRGRAVRSLAGGVMEAGHHRVRWDGRDGQGDRAAPGVYFYRLETGDKTLTRRMVLLP